MRVVGISGSLSANSRTSRLVAHVLAAARQHAGVETELIEIAERRLVFCDGRRPDLYDGDTRFVIDRIVAADACVVGSPVYRGSYTGALKNLFDLLPNEALRGKPVGLVATAGSDHHFLAVEHALRPLLSFFQAYTVPGAVYAHNGHFVGERLDETTAEQCRLLGDEIVRLAVALGGGAAGPAYPKIERKPGQRPQEEGPAAHARREAMRL
ncbi:MAG TPA: NAD(P)H-dependent oxidoreductase [Xanthobacteraceae bacterium]|nr:NAD(P)H-dependent oxidoreductase [Xanthobacteraceae bacterium]